MKKFLAVMVLAVLAFTACNKDDNDDNAPRKPITTFAGKLLKEFDDYHYKYDEFGRCKTMSHYESTFEIQYDKGIIMLENRLADIKFNKQGYIEKNQL